MKSFYLDKFQYTFDKNQELISYLVDNKDLLNEKIHILISHTLNAHEIWNTRIVKQPTNFKVWQLHDWNQMLEIDKSNFDLTKSILESKKLDEVIAYTTSTGENYHNKIEDLLFHIVNHCTYHRGQINAELKKLGLTPTITDYVFYKRT